MIWSMMIIIITIWITFPHCLLLSVWKLCHCPSLILLSIILIIIITIIMTMITTHYIHDLWHLWLNAYHPTCVKPWSWCVQCQGWDAGRDGQCRAQHQRSDRPEDNHVNHDLVWSLLMHFHVYEILAACNSTSPQCQLCTNVFKTFVHFEQQIRSKLVFNAKKFAICAKVWQWSELVQAAMLARA